VLLLRLASAPLPCGPELSILLEVGGKQRYVSLSQEIEHGTVDERDCILINDNYEGYFSIGCDEGVLNATVEACFPRRCLTYNALTARLGDITLGVSPLETIAHAGQEDRLCRTLNPLYRGSSALTAGSA